MRSMSGYADGEEDDGGSAVERAAGYERWVGTVLRPKLDDYRERIAKIEKEMGQYAELKKHLSTIMVREEEGPLEMLTDLGADCYAKAQVDDPSRVFVHVALGFHVEFTLSEAIHFSDVKRSSLSEVVAKLKAREAEVAKDVLSAEEMIQGLRALSTGIR